MFGFGLTASFCSQLPNTARAASDGKILIIKTLDRREHSGFSGQLNHCRSKLFVIEGSQLKYHEYSSVQYVTLHGILGIKVKASTWYARKLKQNNEFLTR